MNKFKAPSFLQPKSVDSVMAVFTKTISDLDAVAAAAKAKSMELQVKRDTLFAEQVAAEREAISAINFSAKLSKLLGA